MKNKKGFTLIELLAIIVILAIIAVITVPIILNIIENSKRGTVQDSALGYRDSIHKFYASNQVLNSDEESPSGYKTVSFLANSGLMVNGEVPTEGWVKLYKGQVMDYSLKFGDYVANYDKSMNLPIVIKNGDLKENPALSKVGDELCFGPDGEQECFKVIKKHIENGVEKTILFANYNLKKYTDNTTSPATITYKQDAFSPDGVSFSQTDYWMDETQNPYILKSDYSNNGSYIFVPTREYFPFVDTNNNNVFPYIYDSNSNTFAYVEGYLTTLKSEKYGLSSSATGRLLTKEESDDSSIFDPILSRKNGFNYWNASAGSYYAVYCVQGDGTRSGNGCNHSQGNVGVRPVIIVPTDDL